MKLTKEAWTKIIVFHMYRRIFVNGSLELYTSMSHLSINRCNIKRCIHTGWKKRWKENRHCWWGEE